MKNIIFKYSLSVEIGFFLVICLLNTFVFLDFNDLELLRDYLMSLPAVQVYSNNTMWENNVNQLLQFYVLLFIATLPYIFITWRLKNSVYHRWYKGRVKRLYWRYDLIAVIAIAVFSLILFFAGLDDHYEYMNVKDGPIMLVKKYKLAFYVWLYIAWFVICFFCMYLLHRLSTILEIDKVRSII